ncbi:MAG TPA: hypothetical protein VIM70_03470 [Clostridium sp.]|uniref:hypothetical protein n=1 Tax=Clostridium sp. TaxID=1506 RepID=UPI002F92C1EC
MNAIGRFHTLYLNNDMLDIYKNNEKFIEPQKQYENDEKLIKSINVENINLIRIYKFLGTHQIFIYAHVNFKKYITLIRFSQKQSYRFKELKNQFDKKEKKVLKQDFSCLRIKFLLFTK